MDWSAVLIYGISIAGAIYLAEGSWLMGIIAFLIIFGILAVIAGIIRFFYKLTKKPPVKPQPAQKVQMYFKEDFFWDVHNQVIIFLQAYSCQYSGEWYHYFLSQEFEHMGDQTDGYLKFELLLGRWDENRKFSGSDSADYIKTCFSYDPQRTAFTFKMRTAISTNGAFPETQIHAMLKDCLNRYEAKHPEVRMERHHWGASLHRNG